MKIRMTQTRMIQGIGLKKAGDMFSVNDALAEQLIRQNFAEAVAKRPAKAETET